MQFEIQKHKPEFEDDLTDLKKGTLAIVNLLVGSGVYELRLHFGPGYRIYFGEVDRTIVLLLCGGDKSTQTQDIRRAKTYWSEHKEERQ